MDNKVLGEHAEKHEKLRGEILKKKSDNRAQSLENIQQRSPFSYKSRFYEKNIKLIEEKKQVEEARGELKQLLLDKKSHYSRYVKDAH